MLTLQTEFVELHGSGSHGSPTVVVVDGVVVVVVVEVVVVVVVVISTKEIQSIDN